MNRLRLYRSVLETNYTDRMTIFRMQDGKRGGETVLTLEEVSVSLPCRISQTGLAKNQQTSVQNDIRYDAKLFCAPEWDIRQGDTIDVTRGARTRRYIAGEPFPYDTHQEVGLQRKDRA
ncbi:MAG: ABC transporter ATP-binding protein [Paenibacillus dendritiformis]|uniref:ABC transporter ATP-binding protein n=1 Tax=uncultured Paenibacillus sp. TaxID=227322 RepID=UPI0025E8E275|nr:ABC transporter ATP-binding protein [uncultured Paenibacillus sp.]MDU5141068.1 ABC transporter ATP-binding protein [Paenibacillus dendritiformis]